jgi:hypothetical protein
VVAGIGLALGPGLEPVSLGLGVLGLLAVLRGARNEDRLWQGMLAAAVLWTVAWALGSA